MVSVSIANGSGSAAVATIESASGLPLSALLTGSASRDSDTVTPSFTVARARFRVSSVIRLIVPRSSSLPQRFQLDRSVIQRSIVAASMAGGDCARSAGDDDKADATTNVRARIERDA